MVKILIYTIEVASLTRYLVPQIRHDLARKMVFVAGPRQVGKTTLVRRLPGDRPDI
jgi:predicted AAA+ superfamily ATPase